MCMCYLTSECSALKDFDKIIFSYENYHLSIYEGFLSYGSKQSPYAKYYIIDIDEQDENSNILSLFQSFDEFYRFQSSLLEKFFYSVSADLKYNIYLVIISTSISKPIAKTQILADYNFGRKYIFNDEEAKSYFNMCYSLEKKNVEALSEYLPNILKYEAYWIEYMKTQNNFFDAMLIKNSRKRNFSHMFRWKQLYKGRDYTYSISDIIKKKLLMESIETHKHRLDELMHIVRNNHNQEKPSENVSSAQIGKINFTNYRNFGEKRELAFGKVNLLYGENGAGKTSIIEAIEKCFTGQLSYERSFGEVHHNEGERLVATIKNMEGKEIELSNDNLEFCMRNWYGSDDFESANRAFLRYNYFDIKGAFRFAITEKEDSEYNFYDFLVDTDLAKLNKNLETTIKEIEELHIAISQKLSELNENVSNIPQEKRSGKYYTLEKSISTMLCSDLLLKDKEISDNMDFRELMKSILHERKKECEESLQILKNLPKPPQNPEKLFREIFDKILSIFSLITANRDYSDIFLENDSFSAKKTTSKINADFSFLSAGQKICFALSTLLALFLSNDKTPNFLIFDEPVSHLDTFHLLNLLDILRELSINGIQIIFTTSNHNISKLFRRKFSFLGPDFKCFKLSDEPTKTRIVQCSFNCDPSEVTSEIEL